MCLVRDSLWSQLYNVIDNTLASEDETTVSLLEKADIVGEDVNTTLTEKLHNVDVVAAEGWTRQICRSFNVDYHSEAFRIT